MKGFMRLDSCDMRHHLDHQAIHEFKIPSRVLMEHAGLNVARHANTFAGQFIVYCGGGHNGGDGLIVARNLKQWGRRVSVVLPQKPYKDVCADVFETFCCFDIPTLSLDSVEEKIGHGPLCIIDAVTGTGLTGELIGELKLMVESIQRLRQRELASVVSVDLPSGLVFDSMKIPQSVVVADMTVTFGQPGIAHICSPARDYVGELICEDIGIPCSQECYVEVPQSDVELRPILNRPRSWHKGDAGHVLIIGGAPGMNGAPLLAAQSALYSGCGKVSLFTPLTTLNTLPEVMHQKGIGDGLGEQDIDQVKKLIVDKNIDVIVAGMGLGEELSSIRFLKEILDFFSGPVVLDADGLRVIAEGFKPTSNQVVLTPHPGEYQNILGQDMLESSLTPIEDLQVFSREIDASILYKSATPIFCSVGEVPSVFPYGNSGLATGGVGDTLSGIIGSFIAQSRSLKSGVRAGMSLLQLTAGTLEEKYSILGITPSRIAESLHSAILSQPDDGPK